MRSEPTETLWTRITERMFYGGSKNFEGRDSETDGLQDWMWERKGVTLSNWGRGSDRLSLTSLTL